MNQFEWKLTENLYEIARRLYHTGYLGGSASNLLTILTTDEMKHHSGSARI